MKKILVSGLINIETSLKVGSFPINYSPIEYPFFGVENCVSGVGYNVAKALEVLGSDVDLLSIIGDDVNGEVIKTELKRNNIDISHLISYPNTKTAESVVLVDKDGKRKIYCDLKDLQDREPLDENVIQPNNYSLAVLTNVNFNRKLLEIFHKNRVTIASDVHVLSSLEDAYNDAFVKYSNILFLSNEAIIDREADFMKLIYQKYHNHIIVCGCGSQGALMYIGSEDKYYYEPAIAPRGIASTVGAGDALFSAFIHFYNKGMDLSNCLKKAVLFAGIKISSSGGSNGFVKEDELK
ncbi:MAG: carbohydrate kinase family protein [Bacilli bacterium]|nr:carbohydrate kinase family protein [Bacilli bacterium]